MVLFGTQVIIVLTLCARYSLHSFRASIVFTRKGKCTGLDPSPIDPGPKTFPKTALFTADWAKVAELKDTLNRPRYSEMYRQLLKEEEEKKLRDNNIRGAGKSLALDYARKLVPGPLAGFFEKVAETLDDYAESLKIDGSTEMLGELADMINVMRDLSKMTFTKTNMMNQDMDSARSISLEHARHLKYCTMHKVASSVADHINDMYPDGMLCEWPDHSTHTVKYEAVLNFITPKPDVTVHPLTIKLLTLRGFK